MVDATDAVAVEEVRATRVQEDVTVPSEKSRSRSGHLRCDSVRFGLIWFSSVQFSSVRISEVPSSAVYSVQFIDVQHSWSNMM